MLYIWFASLSGVTSSQKRIYLDQALCPYHRTIKHVDKANIVKLEKSVGIVLDLIISDDNFDPTKIIVYAATIFHVIDFLNFICIIQNFGNWIAN